MNNETKTYKTSVACKVGVVSAVIYHYFCNNPNGIYLNGRYWVCGSVKELTKIFPEFTGKQIYSALQRLLDCDYIDSAKLSIDQFNHTKWYTADPEIGGTGK